MTLTKLPAALAKFQAQHHAAGRDGKGNYGTYTTLAGALAAVQPACALGLSHTQLMVTDEHGLKIRTVLMHESGEQVESDTPVLYEGGRGNQMQALGSAITYARRYGLLGIYGVAGDDDDGEGATQPKPPAAANAAPASKPKPKPAPTPAKAPAADPADQPLSADERKLCLALLKDLPPDQLNPILEQFRQQFNVPAEVKVSAAITTQAHLQMLQAAMEG